MHVDRYEPGGWVSERLRATEYENLARRIHPVARELVSRSLSRARDKPACYRPWATTASVTRPGSYGGTPPFRASGRLKENVEPWCGVLVNHMRPPFASTMCLAR